MIKNFKMATLWGVLLWVLIFVEISIVMFIPPFAGDDKEMLRNIIHYVALIFLAWFTLAMYFKHDQASAKTGLVVAFYFLVVGTILDMVITVPLFVKDYAEYFKSIYVWIGYPELLILGYIFGLLFAKKTIKTELPSTPADLPPVENNKHDVI